MADDAVPTRAELVRLYLDTLRARMDPDEFRLLGRLLSGAVGSLADAGDTHVVEVGEQQPSRQVQEEFLAVLSIVATGTIEHRLVDLGDGAVTVLDVDAAENPEAVRRMQEWAARQRDRGAGAGEAGAGEAG
ncbi:hypothetical protein ACFC6L_22075 [Kitasatospora phosalacinea]|uniref:hypothetical protein n=1 Tax=Kitasatospora phosalacinea TaxID=2065 RepID=UPI0035E1F26A